MLNKHTVEKLAARIDKLLADPGAELMKDQLGLYLAHHLLQPEPDQPVANWDGIATFTE